MNSHSFNKVTNIRLLLSNLSRVKVFWTMIGISFLTVIFGVFPTSRIVSLSRFKGIINKSITTQETLLFNSSTDSSDTVPQWYPDLPIGIYSDVLNITRIATPSKPKLIILFNSFFGDPKWEMKTLNTNSNLVMRELNCPFLDNFCEISDDRSRTKSADAVIFHMRNNADKDEASKYRQNSQRFIFALWESPAHSPNMKIYQNYFNWTFTYRFDSHIVSTYFFQFSYIHRKSLYFKQMLKENISKSLNLKTSSFNYSQIDLGQKRSGTAVALITNCGGISKRIEYIGELRKYIDVKICGRCGQPCPTNVNCRQYLAENYYFFLSFENSLCNDYTTEKLFAILTYPIALVVLGRGNYTRFIPRSAYINTRDFASLQDLARFLNATIEDPEKYKRFFDWKKDYVWGINHFMTPFCDLCWRLHTDSKPNIIEDIHSWWHDKQCFHP